MKNLSYNDIKKREISLNSHSNKTALNIPYLFEKLGEQYSFNNAKIIIENWKNLSDNEIESFDKALETFLIVCENDNECNIKSLSNIMETKLIQKARDAKATRHLNNYKLGKFKIYNTKINNKVKASKDNVKNAIANKGKVINIYHPNRKYEYDIYGKRRDLNNKSISKKDDESKNKTVNECFDSFISISNTNDKCDRILENNRILMNKFNFDNKVRSCKLYKNSIIDCIYELCQFIDTYDASDIVKYNIALENIYYTMHKNCINIPDESIIESVTDYFLLTRNNIDNKYIDNIKYSLDNIELYAEQDLEVVNYLYNDNDVISESTYLNSCDYLDNLLLESSKKEKNKNNSKTKNEINKFKMAKEKTIDGLKSLITRFFCNSKENIVKGLPDIFAIIRNGLVLGTFAISPTIGIISIITNQILRLEISRDEANKVLKEYDKEISYYQKKCDDANGDDYEKYNKIMEKLEQDKDKYAEYEKTLYSEKQIEKRYQNANESTDLYNLALIQNMAPLIESMDWDIKSTMENIKENVYYFDPETIYTLTETVLLCPNIFDINVYKNILEDCRQYHRRCNNWVTKYMVIDSLNVCLRKLNECNNKINLNETYDLEKSYLYNTYFQEVMNDTIELVNSFTPLNEFSINNKDKKKNDTSSDIRIDNKDINIHSKHTITVGGKFKNKNLDDKKPDLKVSKKSKPAIENIQDNVKKSGINITSKLKLAQSQLKRSTEALKDKEKELSEKIDVDMSQTHKSIEKALTNNNREAVIKGSLIPSASRCIKAAVITGAAWAVNPAIAVIGAVGAFAMSKKLQKRERQLILDDIEIELQMCDKYLRIAEDKNDMKATRNILQTKRALQRQQQRLKYDMSVHFETPPKVKNTNGDINNIDENYIMLSGMEVL